MSQNKRRKLNPSETESESESLTSASDKGEDDSLESAESDASTIELNLSDTENEPKEPVTCIGCQYNAPGQLAHMDSGGCLHSQDESSEDPSRDDS